ncbi:MAG TPA: MBL fold metallo-hydrolase [Dinghuibacter sp.]|uniref:MBL fold metallo-hydrolase n=1 Tax=Dinghuibacter sp. TaxID=2024697 RepID=UPI002CE4F231|nr:MBL fold metallo-hydrolase [Dinghuibacter sp.]HTJ14330.1 MBL fold metallo-hydrolase [Dinghuibacter sp.]
MNLTITAYSTALFSTWYFIEEWGVLFDAGDGMISALLQKSRKVDNVFISHADRDHLTGLLQFNQLNARPGQPVIHYPKDASSFEALESFSKKFDTQVAQTQWIPVTEGDEIPIARDLLVLPIRNGHVPAAPEVIKSLGYQVVQTRKKLKPEFAHLSGEDIRQLGERIGRENLSIELRSKLLAYSGDTPVEDGARWDNTEILIHEATFLGQGEDIKVRTYGNKHSTLEEVMEMVGAIHIGKLVLGHFSSRYTHEEIDRAIMYLCDKYAIGIPVYRLLPGATVVDVLAQEPINR